jgi:Tat protein secretion system quality control protein TatD with DNase activity
MSEGRGPMLVDSHCHLDFPDFAAERDAVVKQERPPPGVLHCFSSGRALAETAIALGFYVSISGIVTFRNAEELRGIVRDLPLDR